MIKQFRFADHSAGIAHQILQQHELARRQIRWDSIDPDLTACGIELQIARAEHNRTGSRTTPQQGSDPSQ
jgi:hypothetical protein